MNSGVHGVCADDSALQAFAGLLAHESHGLDLQPEVVDQDRELLFHEVVEEALNQWFLPKAGHDQYWPDITQRRVGRR